MLAAGTVTFRPSAAQRQPCTQPVPEVIVAQFQGFRAGAVALAGLLDGINPCAFTTVVFLLSMLPYLGKTKRELAVVGVGFTAAEGGGSPAMLRRTIRSYSWRISPESEISVRLGAAASDRTMSPRSCRLSRKPVSPIVPVPAQCCRGGFTHGPQGYFTVRAAGGQPESTGAVGVARIGPGRHRSEEPGDR